MAPLPDYVSGTITLTNGSPDFTGTGTGWLAAGFREGDTILGIEDNEGVTYVVAAISDNDAGTLTQPWQGATGTYAYRMRYLSDGQRTTAQARQLIELLGNGNLQALAGLPGTAQTVPTFTGAGAMIETPLVDFITGVAFNVQVDTMPERDAYDGEAEGFTVLVGDVGDGRSAIYSKLSATSGDWSDPAYITGPSTSVTVGTVTELDYGETPTITGTSGPGTLELDFGLPGGPGLSVGSVTRGDVNVTSTPVTGGFELDFTIPAQAAMGDYSGSTAYVTGDIVQDSGSSWVALQDTTGNAPPSLPTTSNAWWQLLARAGNDGEGTVTMLVGGDGIDIDSTDPTMPVIGLGSDATVFLDIMVGDGGSGGTKGLVPAPAAGDAAAGKFLSAAGTWVEIEQGGYDPNIALLALEVADLKGERLGMVGGIADPFTDESGVDTAGSQYAAYDAENDWYEPDPEPAVYDTLTSVVLDTNGSAISSSWGIRMEITALGTNDGIGARVTMEGPTSGSMTVDEAFIGHAATAPNFDGSQVPITVGGNTSFVLGTGEVVVSDPLTFSYDNAKGLILSIQGAGPIRYRNATVSGWAGRWIKSSGGSGDAGLTSVSGYTLSNSVVGYPFSKVEVMTSDEVWHEMVLVSETFTAAAQPETVRLALQVVENEPVVINTDIVGEVSRDGGTTWTAATLSLISETGGAKLYEDAEIDVTGQPSGISVKWRATTTAGADIAISGVVEQWR